MPAAIPCKTQKNRGETCRSIGKNKTKYACVVDADESMRTRLEGRTAQVSWRSHRLSNENTICECSSGWRMGKIEKIPAWQLTKVRNKKEVIDEARNKGRKVHFASLMDLCHLKNSELEAPISKTSKVELYSEVTLWKMIQDHTQYLQGKDHQHHRWQPPKSWTLFQDYQDAQDKQQTQYQLAPRSQRKMHYLSKKSEVSVSRFLDTSTERHGWPKSWSSMEDRVVPPKRKLYGHPLAGLLWERQFEKVLLEHGWGKVPRKRTILLVCVCGRFKNWLGRDTTWTQCEKCSWKTLVWERTDIIPWPCFFGLHSTRMRNEQRYCGQLQKCLNPGSLQEQKKNYFVQGNLPQTSSHGLWKVMQRNVRSDIASWRTKHTSNCTKLQLHALMTINWKKKKKLDQLENYPQFADTLYCNVYIWLELVDLIFDGLWTSLLVRSRKTDCFKDLRAFPSYWRSWSFSWSFRSIYCLFKGRWHSGFRYTMGPRSIICKCNTQGKCPGKFVQDENTWICSASDRISCVWTSCQRLKTMVRRFIDHMIRTRNLRAMNEKIETEVLVKVKKGRMSALKEKWKNVFSGEQMDSVQEESLAVSSTVIIVDSKHNRPLLLQRHRHGLTEESHRKAVAPGEKVLLEGKLRGRATITSKEFVQVRHVIIGIFPYVKTNLYRDPNSATNVCLDTLRLMRSPVQLILTEGVFSFGLCVSWFSSEKVFSAGSWKIGIESHRQVLPRHMAPHKTSGKRGFHRKVRFKSANLKIAIRVRQILRWHFRNPCNKRDAPAEKHRTRRRSP